MKTFTLKSLLLPFKEGRGRLLTLIAAICCAVTIQAERINEDGLYYNLDPETMTATVTYETGNPSANYASLQYARIDSTVKYNKDNYKVVGIEDNAFVGSPIKFVYLRKYIVSIGENAFMNCDKLESVFLYDNDITLKSIGTKAFYNCANLSNFILPTSLQTIGESAFYNCKKLPFADIPEGCVTIPKQAFRGCEGLMHISIPTTIKFINEYAFYGCKNLKSITKLSEGIHVLNPDELVFGGIDNPADITLRVPMSVRSLYRKAEVWSDFNVQGFVKGENGILYLLDTDNLTAAATYRYFNVAQNYNELSGTVRIPSCVKYNGQNYLINEIGDFAFAANTSMLEIKMPSLLRVGKSAFMGTNIRNIVIPEGVTALEDSVLYNCSELLYIDLPSTLSSLGDNSINKCSLLNTIYNRNPTAVDVGNNFLTMVTANITLYVPSESVEAYQSATVWRNFGTILPFSDYGSGKCGDNLNWTFSPGDGELSISGIGDMWDYNYPDLAPWYAMRDKLTTVEISSGVTSIGDYAFYLCSWMEDLSLPEGITSIGKKAFTACLLLEEVVIPSSLTHVTSDAFDDCTKIKTVAWNAKNCNGINFGPQVTSFTFGEGVQVIPDSICMNMSKIKNISLPAAITAIGERAFEGCTALQGLFIPATVKSMGYHAFFNCPNLLIFNELRYAGSNKGLAYLAGVATPNLAEYTILNNTKWIGEEVFYGQAKLKEITIPSSVIEIREKAFALCTALNTITLSENLETIGESAFDGCTSLRSIRIYATTPPALGDNTFSGLDCEKVYLYVPREGMSAYQADPQWGAFFIRNHDQIYGSCGDNITWWLDTVSNELVISGTGATWDFPDDNPGWHKWAQQIQSIVIEDGVTVIGNSIFYNMWDLKSVQIPASVTEIKDYAFMISSAITSITCIAPNPPKMGTEVFKGVDCSKIELFVPEIAVSRYKSADQWKDFIIKNAVLPYGMCGDNMTWEFDEQTGRLAFGGNGAMWDFSLKQPGWWAYREAVTNVLIAKDIASVSNLIFDNMPNLRAINVASGNWNYSSQDGILFNKAQTTLYIYPMAKPGDSYTIPETISKIGSYAFSGCTQIKELTCLATTPPTLGTDVFSGMNCAAVTLNVPQESLALYKAADQWKKFNFKGIINPDFQCGDNMTWAFDEKTGTLTISGTGAMWDFLYDPQPWEAFLDDILIIDIQEGVEALGEFAFNECEKATTITLPNSLSTIARGAFKFCEALQSIELPEFMYAINEQAFFGCKALKEIEIPAFVGQVGPAAFGKCESLEAVTCHAVIPPILQAGAPVFMYLDCSKIPLYVPASSVSAYKAAEQWKEFSPIRAIGGPTAIDQTQMSNDKSQMTNKVLRNGLLFIERNGQLYDAQGTRVE